MRIFIDKHDQWAKVLSELEDEELKLRIYDKTILELLGDVRNKKILDYGSGPAVFAKVLHDHGANVKIFDISKEMRELALEKLGRDAVIDHIENIPENYFDIIICNLVVCIIEQSDVTSIVKKLSRSINSSGKIYIGFCNPKIYNIKESQLDFRFPTGINYNKNHDYKKVKKEGNYEIIEKHRPIEWYQNVFKHNQLIVSNVIYTPENEFKGNKIRDFIIFELTK